MSKLLKISEIETNNGQIEGLPKNPRIIRDERFERLKKSITEFPEMLELREIVVFPWKGKFICIGGNMRFLACKDLGFEEVPTKILPKDFPREKLAEFAIKDNASFGENDLDLLTNEWANFPLEDWGLDLPDFFGADDLNLDEFFEPPVESPLADEKHFMVLEFETAEIKEKAAAVVVRAQHLCMAMRGVKKHDTWTVTSELSGVLRDNPAARSEFLGLIGG